MMAEGPMVFLRLPKIRQAIVASPEPMLWFSKNRMELEMLELEICNRYLQCSDENGDVDESDVILQEIRRRKDDIKMEIKLWMIGEGCSENDLDFGDRMLM
ncbi:hypothetical protein DPMN_130769 [Dreissena polymorpha]|uniref:Uncharacterized protein n=1 Tax=Dreissena polymorpha TaxID=45954 RepID=A0A9D4JYP3_DREPO|nr:hypothetical protein DPMN_130769 [Dreissena polymorpha]